MTTTVPHQAIYRRWRAQTFSEIVGQTAVVETLRNAVRTDRVSHAILFVGPRGTGKTSLARILAKALNCTDLRDGDPCDACPSCVSIRDGRALDLVEIDAASNRGIDAIRDLRERINYAPTDLRRKVYILDEAHQITKDAWNALLKSLEEPPDFVAFMFASTHPQDFPPAILSRLQRYDVRRLTVEEIEGKLRRILAAETIEADPEAIGLIARLAAGGMRDAESMLDQVLALSGGRIDASGVRDLLGLAEAQAVDRLVAALTDGDVVAGIALLDELEDRGRDIGVVLEQVMDAIREQLTAAISPGGEASRATGLARVARRLAEIDPERRNVGGLRLQVELALFAAQSPAAVPVFAPAPSPATEPPLGRAPGQSRGAGPDDDAATPEQPTQAKPRRAARPSVATVDGPTADGPAPDGGADPGPSPASTIAPLPAATPTDGDVATRPAGQAEADNATTTAPSAAGSRAPVPSLDAAPPAEPATADGSGAPPDGASALNQLRARWPDIVQHISQHPPTKPLIAACRPISVEGNIVTLGFPEGQAFLKDVAERRRANLEEGIGQFLGRAVAVRCVATNLDLVPPIPAEDESNPLFAEARRIFAEQLLDVEEVS